MKGVFCLEGFWYGDHRDRTSVVPVLEMTNRYLKMPYIYHRCGTVEEFRYSLDRWKTKSFHKKYPILTLAFHGKKGQILIGKNSVSLDELADILETKCQGVVIYFGSCDTMNVSKRKLQSFMEKTRTLAVLGYKQEVDWLKSAAFEIQLLEYFLAHPFDTQGIKKIVAEINASSKHYISELDFQNGDKCKGAVQEDKGEEVEVAESDRVMLRREDASQNASHSGGQEGRSRSNYSID